MLVDEFDFELPEELIALRPARPRRASQLLVADAGSERISVFERLADAELFLLLEAEADGDQIKPRIFEMPEAALVLVFDREDRLTAFTETPAPYAAVSGKVPDHPE